MSIEQFAETLLEKLKTISRAETVIGSPIVSEGATIVPVSRVSVGFGLGGRSANAKSDTNASAGGASIEPVAFLVMKGDNVQVMPITKNSSLANKVVDLVPDLLDTLKKGKKSDDEK